MSRATSDDQLKFLLSCVRHSNNGKVDFVEVAKECGVVSKGAAAKRYERLMKANGIHPSGGQVDGPPQKASTPLKQKPKDSPDKAPSAKKRKTDNANTNTNAGTAPDPDRNEEYNHKQPAIPSPRPEAVSPEPPAGVSVPMSMPPAAAPFFSRPMQGYMFPNQSTRPSFSAYPLHGHPPQASSMSPGMHVHGPFALPMHAPMHFAGPHRNIAGGFDRYNNQEVLYHPQPLPLSMQAAISNETLPATLPPQPQEIEPLCQPRKSPLMPEPREEHPAGHVVIVD
ncbi:hypothetical protein A1O1_02102 [Capronia coronata CBS 617.96]|uniref:Myb-like DNA-binding domain-containing protein n=1 Tax=Capronia coronata CBS 617.96 TaxID=1182541 RepID=W9ZGS0_9EURO|nr:uncharacterized protein A1O1_02102 [Capronia coronata CBS 617.96]EXJ93709.1 hypothetical protein A1O1_02102 [Capronia coronata CBS 617.96]